MKKLLLTSCLFAAITTLSAQSNEGGFNKKDVFISGSFGYESNTVKVDDFSASTSSFTFAPTIGYFVSDNFAIGAGLTFSNQPIDFDGETLDATSFGVRFMGRYYLNPGNKFSTFGQASLAFGSINPELEGADNASTLDLGISPGINYFLSEKFSVEATFGRIGYSSLSLDGYTQSNVGINLNLSTIGLGINYKF